MLKHVSKQSLIFSVEDSKSYYFLVPNIFYAGFVDLHDEINGVSFTLQFKNSYEFSIGNNSIGKFNGGVHQFFNISDVTSLSVNSSSVNLFPFNKFEYCPVIGGKVFTEKRYIYCAYLDEKFNLNLTYLKESSPAGVSVNTAADNTYVYISSNVLYAAPDFLDFSDAISNSKFNASTIANFPYYSTDNFSNEEFFIKKFEVYPMPETDPFKDLFSN